MKNMLFEAMLETPIIAAAKDMDTLRRSLASDSRIVFVLFGDICNIGEIVSEIQAHGRFAMVHIDLIAGLSAKEAAVDFIKKTGASGIISTKPLLVRRANELGMITIQRFFLLDSLALENTKKQIELSNPDIIEVLPGTVHKTIKSLCEFTRIPIIAGGLIADKEDVLAALKSGATAVSSSNPGIWFL